MLSIDLSDNFIFKPQTILLSIYLTSSLSSLLSLLIFTSSQSRRASPGSSWSADPKVPPPPTKTLPLPVPFLILKPQASLVQTDAYRVISILQFRQLLGLCLTTTTETERLYPLTEVLRTDEGVFDTAGAKVTVWRASNGACR